jgi:hypothetical protein
MKRQGDKNFQKKKRKENCALEHGVWRLEERKGVLMASFG